MKLLFFQNCISPHQMPYIEVLAHDHDVTVVAPRVAYGERAAMGWNENEGEESKVKILINPSDEVVEKLFVGQNIDNQSQTGVVALFSGISAFPEVHHWFRLSLGKNLKRGIITEAPYTFDKPLWMHKLRFELKDRRFVKCFDYVFAIGEDCAKYYGGRSKHWKVVPFMYCTKPVVVDEPFDRSDALKVCFVGSLDKRKNVSLLLEAVKRLPASVRARIEIVGNGPLRGDLESLAKDVASDNVSIAFLGALPMADTQRIIAQNDILVLPSLHDGWGAVINEAMTLGTIPMCSNKCGAKALINKSGFGGVFDVNSPASLADLLAKNAVDLEVLREKRDERIAWAKENISPEAVANLMIMNL